MELSGGDKLEAALKEIADKMSGSVDVGFMSGARYPTEDNLYVAQVAFWNEYGTSNSPPRPFMRTTIDNQNGEWADRLGKSAVAYDYDGEKTLKDVGNLMKEDIQQAINTWTTPANSEYTIQKKGFNSPLRETMHMLRSVDVDYKP